MDTRNGIDCTSIEKSLTLCEDAVGSFCIQREIEEYEKLLSSASDCLDRLKSLEWWVRERTQWSFEHIYNVYKNREE